MEEKSQRNDGQQAGGSGFHRVLLLALLAGILLHLAGFLIFRVVYRELPASDTARPFVSYHPWAEDTDAAGAAWKERAALLDSAPLFIPTRWNAGAGEALPSGGPAPDVFTPFPPAIDLIAALEPARLFAPGNGGVAQPRNLLDSRFWSFFAQFATDPEPVRPIPQGGPVAVVDTFDDGLPPLRLPVDLPADVLLAVTKAAAFQLRLGWGEIVVEPVLLDSSGSDEFDQAARAWLQTPEVRARLPAGLLRISVFP